VDIITHLSERGLVHQSTNLDGLRSHLSVPQKIYCGFDPTAPSLTIGNLVPIIILAHFQKQGHMPVVVLGGATGLIGDPSGKSAERQLLTAEVIHSNMEGQRRIFERLLDFEAGSNAAVMMDNAAWLSKLGFLEALRDIGKFFSVNEMTKRDSIRERLAREQGLSYTEFSYMLLQAWDFKHLFEKHGVSIQLGGSDQWGNIVPGVDLVRRLCQRTVYGLTCPLVTKADGGKFGKTEAGPVWLTPDRTTPYALYQFFLNTSDEDVARFLRLFTFLPLAQVKEVEQAHLADPGKRAAQRVLAEEATRLIHGDHAAKEVVKASECLFNGDVNALPLHLLLEAMNGVPTTNHSKAQLRGQPMTATELLCVTAVCSSKREAREMLTAGAVAVNGRKLRADEVLTVESLLHDMVLAIRRGKKNWHLSFWE
jgi:tyrosyl-tRNA synthetase